MNTSFDSYGTSNLIEVVTFALTYGERRTINSMRGNHPTTVIVAYIPDVVGSGIKKNDNGRIYPCSGICLMSPDSVSGFDHSFPVLDSWVSQKFKNDWSACRFCSKQTPFGVGVCIDCLSKNDNNWKHLINPTYTICC